MAKAFSLRGRALKLNTAEDLKKHVQPLVDNADVEEIDIEGNTIGVEAAQALAEILATKKNLRIINLADLFTGRLLSEIPPALDALLKSLLQCSLLHTINLNDNAFGLNTVEPLRPFLSQHTPLQHLYLNNNGLGPQAGTYVAEALVKLGENKDRARKEGKEVPNLETVICGRNRLEKGSMAAWAHAYTVNNKVRTVKMVQNGIRIEGIATLIQHGLSKCLDIETLDLQDNTFTIVAAKTLANVVPSWTKILELGVGDSLLTARGGILLGDALSRGKNSLLQVLKLQYNDIDARGIKALLGALEKEALPHLRRLELNGNKFSDEDPSIEGLQTLIQKNIDNNKDGLFKGLDEDDVELWGIDELDELDDEDDDEEGEHSEQDDDDDRAEEGEKLVKDANAAESEPVAQKKDGDVDALADALSKTELK